MTRVTIPIDFSSCNVSKANIKSVIADRSVEINACGIHKFQLRNGPTYLFSNTIQGRTDQRPNFAESSLYSL